MSDSHILLLSPGLIQNLTGSHQRSDKAVFSFLPAEFNLDTYKSAIQAYL